MLSVRTLAAGDSHSADGTAARGETTEGGPRGANESLLDLARRVAAVIEPQRSPLPLTERQYQLLERTADYELWVIHWPVDVGLLLHDHGGSAGAFQVVGGLLEETSTTLGGRRLRRRLIGPGQGRSFGPEYVHSVVNPDSAPATSVHAYSPPLTSMTFYSRSRSGLSVSRVATDWDGAPPD
jgi:Cysteine dioxygenase type I